MYYNTKYNTIQNIYVFSCKKYIVQLKACWFGRSRWIGRNIGRMTGAKTICLKQGCGCENIPILIHIIISHFKAF